MTFFENQRAAQQKTLLLILYLTLAVAGVILAVYGAVVISFVGIAGGAEGKPPTFWYPQIFAFTSLIVLLIVALSLGGRLVSPNTTDPRERKLLNVVEEVAIASGTAVPPVYLLDKEMGVNAFAAGFSIQSAVIGVTRGCMELLTRDELQGVIAHEFSHIINGDMRLNLRLLGITHGILVIGITGYWIFRSSLNSRSRHRSRQDNASQLGFLGFGLALYLVGYIGVFFGRLIRAAVSRQREFLADASAVQFTRNPNGIGGALQKIGGLSQGSKIDSERAEEVSHMFFADGLRHLFFNAFATHPPIKARLRQINPNLLSFNQIDYETTALSASQEDTPGVSAFDQSPPTSVSITPEMVSEGIGAPGENHFSYATRLLQSIPDNLRTEAHEPYGARALVYLLMLDTTPKVREWQLNFLKENVEQPTFSLVLHLQKTTHSLSRSLWLPLIDLCTPTLRLLSPAQYSEFREVLHELARADGSCSLFEYCLHFVLLRHVSNTFEKPTPVFKRTSPVEATQACYNLLRILAIAGHDDLRRREQAFERALIRFRFRPQEAADLSGEPSLDEFDQALKKVVDAKPDLKQPLIEAATTCIATDSLVSIEEAELLRTICEALDCPLPPILGSVADTAN
jgi:Zn-dependent protease with chaperone function